MSCDYMIGIEIGVCGQMPIGIQPDVNINLLTNHKNSKHR